MNELLSYDNALIKFLKVDLNDLIFSWLSNQCDGSTYIINKMFKMNFVNFDKVI